ncbi:hypothetical protein ACVB0D_000698 [Proteus mirabilis]|nr:hypothetical protein [Proteus mirabilis]HBC6190024.1 hypothetical protein [Proteus mirabilis]
MQGINWVNVSERLPVIGDPVIAVLDGTPVVLFLNRVNLNDEITLSLQWEATYLPNKPIPFFDVECWMPIPPMAEGE